VADGAIVKVASLNRPTNVAYARPRLSVFRSPWYQDDPNGKSGTWRTKKSNSLFFGRPEAYTFMTSFRPPVVIDHRAFAFGMHVALTLRLRTIVNV